LYNGGSELNQNSGWYETFFRGYDPTLGRFNQVDPLAHASSSHTPYNFAFNDPVVYNDPNGDYPDEVYTDWRNSGGGGGSADPFFAADGPANYHNTLSMMGGMTAGMAINYALNSSNQFGGSWSSGSGVFSTFSSASQALASGINYVNNTNSWGYTGEVGGYQGSPLHNKSKFKWKVRKGIKSVKYLGENTDQPLGGLTMAEVAEDINGAYYPVGRFLNYITNPEYGPDFFMRSINGWQTANSNNKLIPAPFRFGLKTASWGHNYFPDPNNER